MIDFRIDSSFSVGMKDMEEPQLGFYRSQGDVQDTFLEQMSLRGWGETVWDLAFRMKDDPSFDLKSVPMPPSALFKLCMPEGCEGDWISKAAEKGGLLFEFIAVNGKLMRALVLASGENVPYLVVRVHGDHGHSSHDQPDEFGFTISRNQIPEELQSQS